MTRRRLAPAARREAILRAAADAFDRVDPDQVNIEMVAERAGVSRALVYTYFTNRQGLMRAVFDQVLADLAVRLKEAVGSPTDPQERINRWITALAGYAQAHPNRWQLIRRMVLSHDPDVDHGLDDLLDSLGLLQRDGGAANPLALTALVGMVDWTADQLDEQGASYLARLAWAGTSGVAGAEPPGPDPATTDVDVVAVDNHRNSQGCSSGLPQPAGHTVVPGTRAEG